MNYPPKRLVATLEQAAALRAAGCSWDHVARELVRALGTVTHWPSRFPEFWADRLAAARADLRAGAADESVAVLRTLLRSEDEKVRREAARDLIARVAPAADAPPPRVSDLYRLADFLEGLTDDDRRTLLGDGLPGDAPRPAPGPALDDPPAGP